LPSGEKSRNCARKDRKKIMAILKAFVVILSLLVLTDALTGPFFEKIYSGYPVSGSGYRFVQPTRRRPQTQKPRGRSYKEICRAINPAPYAFPNKIPYPSVPVC
jgi:hypothetical protein